MATAIYCTCNISVLEELKEIAGLLEVHDFQIIDQVIAQSRKGEPRLNTPIWPGYNAVMMLQIQEVEKVKQFISLVKGHNQNSLNEDELITIFTWNIENYIFD